MKKIFTLLIVLTGFMAHAQYSTPGTGVTWGLNELVQNSAGTVILNGDHYEITATLTILPADAIEIMGNVTVLFHELAGIESEGTLIIDAPVQSVFTAKDTTLIVDRWRGFKLIEGHVTQIKNVTFSFGGGIRAQSGTISVDGCTFYKNFYQSGSSGGSYASSAALDISGDAVIVNSSFLQNQRGAVASGSNIACRANIRNNYIFGNTVENSNRPQINMGPSGLSDTTFIVGNTIIGNGSTNAGGIAFSSLTGLGGNVVIDSNLIDLNRYGITLTGSPIHGAIRYNTVTNNNIQNNPDLGGSGLNFTASSASSVQTATVTGNVISGNLWGITIIGSAQVNMGDSTSATFNPGGNQFNDNGNGGILYDLYNNGPLVQSAMYNCWGVPVQDASSIETVIFHEVDDPTLGRVNFMPSCAYETNFIVQNESGTLLLGVEIAIADLNETLITEADGSAWAMIPPGAYSFTASLEGYTTYTGSFTVTSGINTVNITLSGTEILYQLTFTVTNPEAQPLEGVSIEIEGETAMLITDAQGMASIELPDGEYNYTATLTGYIPATGTAQIAGADASVDVVMTPEEPELYTVTFNVSDEFQSPVSGAQVAIDGQNLITSDLGVASLELANGTYPYVVSKEGYYDASGNAVVENGNAEISVVLNALPIPVYLLTFTVTNPEAQPLEGVSIDIDGEVTPLITNAQGVASIELPDGAYNYSATLAGYIPATGAAQIAGANASVDIEMTPEEPQLYTVTFIVDSNMGALGGAEILINGETLITNDEGIATIQLPDGEYPYVATAIDFSTVEGTVIVAGADVEVTVFLQTGVDNPLKAALKVYPNPVVDRLYLDGAKIDAAEVYSITGKLQLRFKQVNGFIDLRDLEQGMYLIRVKSQDLETTLRIVKK